MVYTLNIIQNNKIRYQQFSSNILKQITAFKALTF